MAERIKMKFRVYSPDGTSRTVEPIGRDAWTLDELVKAGRKGCTPIDNPAPRWSGYIHKLRKKYGIAIKTIEEKHGGDFAGTHARYVLMDTVEKISGGVMEAAE